MSTGDETRPWTWTLLGDDMSEQELLDTARQAREDAHPTAAWNDDLYADRAFRFSHVSKRRITIAPGARDAVEREQ